MRIYCTLLIIKNWKYVRKLGVLDSSCLHHIRRKKIVWSEKKTRIRDVIPSWRKKDDPQQPTTPYNKFAINIEKRIIASQESFDGYKIKQEYEKFVADGHTIKQNLKSLSQNKNKDKPFKSSKRRVTSNAPNNKNNNIPSSSTHQQQNIQRQQQKKQRSLQIETTTNNTHTSSSFLSHLF